MLSNEKTGGPEDREAQSIPDDGIRDDENGYNKERMCLLWVVLGVLTAILTAAVIYELILGYGLRETGSERMRTREDTKLQTEVAVSEDETQETETGEEPYTEK